MEKLILLFKYIESRSKPGEFLEVGHYLSELGYKSYETKRSFLEELKADGYIKMRDLDYDPYLLNKQLGVPYNAENDFLEVQLTLKAKEYLQEYERNISTLKSNQEGVGVNKIIVLVALASLLVNIVQLISSNNKDTRIEKRDTTIIQLQSKISVLEIQKDSLSRLLKQK